jgi:CRP/FNR family transcriptional regulator, cyclic AMP receptor protein
MTATIELFRNAGNRIDFPAGHTIFEKGQPGDVMYVVIAGQVDVLIHDKIINSIEPGGILGEMALIDAEPRSATAVAKTDCKLVPINEKRFAFLVQQTPFFAIEVMRTMAERLRNKDPQA